MKNIGLDLDGTVDEMPWFFLALLKGLKGQARIHLITWCDRTILETYAELEELGIKDLVDHVHLPKPEDTDPAKWKKEVIKQEGICLMIEDSPEILAELPANVQRIWLCSPEIYDLKVCVNAMHDENTYKRQMKGLPTV